MIMRISVHVLREPVMESRDRKLQFNPKKRTKKVPKQQANTSKQKHKIKAGIHRKVSQKHSNRNRNQKQIQSKNTKVFKLASHKFETDLTHDILDEYSCFSRHTIHPMMIHTANRSKLIDESAKRSSIPCNGSY
eukprot:761640_1